MKRTKDTSNIDDSTLSDEEAEAQRRKRKRRINAQKQHSSDEKESSAKKYTSQLIPVPNLSQFIKNKKYTYSDTIDINRNEASTSFRNEKEINNGTLDFFSPN